MIFGVAILVLASFVITVFYYLRRLAGDDRANIRRWFLAWVGKGVGVPIVLWTVWNLGILPGLPPMMLHMTQALVGKTQVQAFFSLTANALLVIGSYWAAASFAWFLVLLA